ncbi:MAG TPA: SDR family NAD(P)-dependent oxidoreductase, partial [Candidatus Acidoferrales bacterium]|nr:SDR family NAD(P)-dependent oxidoreductase [Candidatus Acidoferrales bacterium]
MKDRVAIVTGASRGIGRAIALGLAREGAAVVVNNSRADGLAEEVARAICGAGGRALPLQADIRDLDQHERLVRAAVEQFGRLDILVNNAG